MEGGSLSDRLNIDPLEIDLFKTAAAGDHPSLMALASAAAHCAISVPADRNAAGFAGAAEAFGRLAAVHKDATARDRLNLADILAVRALTCGDPEHATTLSWEAVEWAQFAEAEGDPAATPWLVNMLTFLADDGDDEASIELNNIIEKMGPAAAADVREQSRALANAIKATGE